MFNAIAVKRAEVAPLVNATFPDYKGRKFKVVCASTVTLYNLNWDGGSRNVYRTCTTEGQQLGTSARANAAAPWNNPAEGKTLPLPQGAVCVMQSDFCGKDCGLTIYINPEDMPKLLPAAAA